MARPTAESPRISGVTATANVPMTDDLALYQRLKADAANEDAPLAAEIAHSLGVMRDAFRLYGPERVVSSFNGGKDAVAILHLSLAALAGYNEETGGDSRLRIIFFEMDDEFPEIGPMVQRRFAEEGDVQAASKMILESDALQRTRDLAVSHAQQAADAIGVLPPSPARDALLRLCFDVLNRKA